MIVLHKDKEVVTFEQLKGGDCFRFLERSSADLYTIFIKCELVNRAPASMQRLGDLRSEEEGFFVNLKNGLIRFAGLNEKVEVAHMVAEEQKV